jgi:hypothetical protein
VAQGVSPEFKPQYHKKRKKRIRKSKIKAEILLQTSQNKKDDRYYE